LLRKLPRRNVPLEESAAGVSGNGNDGILAGNYYFTEGLSGAALRVVGDGALFYTSGGHMLMPPFDSTLNEAFTLSYWGKDEEIYNHHPVWSDY
jgi:hypothetical protein